MSDDAPVPVAPVPAAVPAAVPVSAQPWMMQPSNDQIVRMENEKKNRAMLAKHDAARAAAGTTTLVATCGFTIVDEENPDGRVINPGDEFTISDFDLPRYRGRGLPRVVTAIDAPRRGI